MVRWTRRSRRACACVVCMSSLCHCVCDTIGACAFVGGRCSNKKKLYAWVHTPAPPHCHSLPVPGVAALPTRSAHSTGLLCRRGSGADGSSLYIERVTARCTPTHITLRSALSPPQTTVCAQSRVRVPPPSTPRVSGGQWRQASSAGGGPTWARRGRPCPLACHVPCAIYFNS